MGITRRSIRGPCLEIRASIVLAFCGVATCRELLQDGTGGGTPRAGPLEPNWSLYQSSAESRVSCSVTANGTGCSLGQSRMSHAIPSLRQASRGGAYRDFVLAELQCRLRSTEEACGLEGQRAAQAQARERAKKHEQQTDPIGPQPAQVLDSLITFTSGHSAFGSGEVIADPSDAIFEEHASSLDVVKCRWDSKAGCTAMASRMTLESVVNVCSVDSAPIDSRTDGFDVEMDIRVPILAAAEAECYRHSKTWLGCRAALHGACVWVEETPPAFDPQDDYDIDVLSTAATVQQADTYSEAGRCELASDRTSAEGMYESLECASSVDHMNAFSDYLILSEICDSAQSPGQCAVLGESQACRWGGLGVCTPSLSVLLSPLGQFGQRLANDTRSCEQMAVTDGTCVDPGIYGILGAPVMDALTMTKRENPLLILAVLIGFLILGFAALRRFHSRIASRHT